MYILLQLLLNNILIQKYIRKGNMPIGNMITNLPIKLTTNMVQISYYFISNHFFDSTKLKNNENIYQANYNKMAEFY